MKLNVKIIIFTFGGYFNFSVKCFLTEKGVYFAMVNVLLVGCLGRLGLEISNYISELENYNVVAGVDIAKDGAQIFNNKYKIYKNIQDVDCGDVIADVVIDFSNKSALSSTLNYCEKTNTPLVLGTTGIGPEGKAEIIEIAKKVPIFWAYNMSVGVNVLIKLCALVMEQCGDIFEVDIIEKHHSKKLDAPSGTATMIADLIKLKSKELYNQEKTIIYDRHCLNTTRGKNEIGINSIRAGNIVGEHSVMFTYGDEVLTLSHTSNSKKVFAQGAIKAANFILNKKGGIYNFNNLGI